MSGAFTAMAAGAVPRRLLRATGSLVVAATAVVLFVATLRLQLPPPLTAASEIAAALLDSVRITTQLARSYAAVLFAIVAMMAVAVFVRQLSYRGARSPRLLLALDELGAVVVDTKGVEAVAEHACKRASGVLDARATVYGPVTGPANVAVDLTVLPYADAKAISMAAREHVRNALESSVGITVASVRVRVSIASTAKLARHVQ